MVKDQVELDGVFHALAHTARRDMVRRLVVADLTVGQLAGPLAMSLAAASKHVQVLERAGLVHRTVTGRRHVVRLDPERLAGAAAWLRYYERLWQDRLTALEGIFAPEQEDTMTTTTAEVRVTRTIPAEPERVYRAWLEPDLLTRWLAPGMPCFRAEVDERIGGRYRVWQGEGGTAGGFEAEIVELVPAERIVWRWGFVGPERLDGPVYDSLLTVTFTPAGTGRTGLTLVHERLGDLVAGMPEAAEYVGPGWELVLGQLAALLA